MGRREARCVERLRLSRLWRCVPVMRHGGSYLWMTCATTFLTGCSSLGLYHLIHYSPSRARTPILYRILFGSGAPCERKEKHRKIYSSAHTLYFTTPTPTKRKEKQSLRKPHHHVPLCACVGLIHGIMLCCTWPVGRQHLEQAIAL